ncbi:coiled-coil domain-containing protein 22 homolog [Artemia franciscana]|uniref:coiled-coil domain-containing protein 22 homolog n=1 Tax=Artemia franciscana TaxID=6661 RepID=UPI0032DBBCD5
MDFNSLEDIDKLSPRELILGVIHCLKQLKAEGSNSIPTDVSTSLPEKYKLSTSLVSIIQNIGYHGNLGYDTFLYGSESELKKILLFLQGLLPSDRKIDIAAHEEREKLIKQVQNQINVLEAPTANAYWKTRASLLANASESERHALWKVLQKISIQRGNKKGKPPLPPKPTDKHDQELKMDKSHKEEKKVKLSSLKKAIENTELEIATLSANIDKGSIKIEAEKSKLLSFSGQTKAKKIAVGLYENYDYNMEHLKEKLQEIQIKRESMEEQWKEVKQNLLLTQKKLKIKKDTLVGDHEKEQKIVDNLANDIASTKNKIIIAETLLRTLETEQAKFSSSTEKIHKRSHYTKKILEFNRTLEKQNEEARKVLEDIRVVQRCLNNTAGKLGRGFSEAEEHLFQTALKISNAKPCYKYFTELHYTMDEIVSYVQEKGVVDREIDSLEGEVHFERRKNVKEKFAKICNDIQNLKQ